MVLKKRILKDGNIKLYDYETNKEYHKKYNNKYYDDNKNKMLVRIDCNCGGHYSSCVKARHEKTKRHLKYLNNLDSK